MAEISDVTDATFESEVLKSTTPVLVDFWAEWCGPCKAIAPIVKEIADDNGDKLKVVKINIDESPQTPGNYGIRSIPTILMFKDGQGGVPGPHQMGGYGQVEPVQRCIFHKCNFQSPARWNLVLANLLPTSLACSHSILSMWHCTSSSLR